MVGAVRTVSRTWPDTPAVRTSLTSPRCDLVEELRVSRDGATGDALNRGDDDAVHYRFEQRVGPFTNYERTVTAERDELVETTRYRLAIPWFGILFALPVKWFLARRAHHPSGSVAIRPPWWAPPDRIDERQAMVLGLLAVAAMASAFTNTLFTQTVSFAADEFGVSDAAVGDAGAIVRAGIIIAIPFGIMADRVGRRRAIRVVAWAAPTICALGAAAPNFAALVATQTIGRPLGLALDLLIAVVAAEEMPRNSRAYAVSIMAMASGFGAGIAVMALPLADLGPSGWRLVYLVTLVWLVIAVDLSRRLPETKRFTLPHVVAPRIDRRRFAVLAGVAICANFFVAPASFFQNTYLTDIRGYNASTIALFTLVTATPAGLGLIVGGRLADARGRRGLIAFAIPFATLLVLGSYLVGGVAMWFSAFGGGFVGGIAYPAIAVYRAELFPTGNRGRAAGLLTASALVGGIFGLRLVGQLVDSGYSYGQVLGFAALGQVVVVILVLTQFPETAHRALEELNPEDPIIATTTAPAGNDVSNGDSGDEPTHQPDPNESTNP